VGGWWLLKFGAFPEDSPSWFVILRLATVSFEQQYGRFAGRASV